MKKLLVVLALLAVVDVLTVYLGGGWWVAGETRRLLPQLLQHAERTGVKIARFEFEGAALRPLATARWDRWRIEFTPPARGARTRDPIRVRVAEVSTTLAGISPLSVDVAARGMVLDSAIQPEVAEDADVPFASDEFGLPVEKVDEGFVVVPALDLSQPPATIANTLLSDVLTFLREGRTTRKLTFGARVHFRLEGVATSARLETERRGDFTYLRLNRADLTEVLTHYRRRLTPHEMDLVCEFPLRAPLLLRIKEYAERVSKRLAASDRAYGEDFTRHVLWSYWLTRTFGAEFAQRVTDAHETATDNTAAEHRQDFANNAVGRGYAAAKKTEWQVLQAIKTDPAVVRVAR